MSSVPVQQGKNSLLSTGAWDPAQGSLFMDISLKVLCFRGVREAKVPIELHLVSQDHVYLEGERAASCTHRAVCFPVAQ